VAHAPAGKNAIHKAARDIARLAGMRFEPHDSLGQTRAQVTQIAGGLARNQVPDACEFYADLRTTPNLRQDEIVRQIGDVLESEVAVHSTRYLPMATDPAEPIVQAALDAANKRTPVGSHTASDWAFLDGFPAVKAGPGETSRSHRPNEYLLLSELEAGAQFYERAVRGWFARAASEVPHA
jgi:acetylornithine deacetylase